MRYAMLIYVNEAASTASQASEDQMTAYAAFGREVSERSLLLILMMAGS
jgi:hypothetical protein